MSASRASANNLQRIQTTKSLETLRLNPSFQALAWSLHDLDPFNLYRSISGHVVRVRGIWFDETATLDQEFLAEVARSCSVANENEASLCLELRNVGVHLNRFAQHTETVLVDGDKNPSACSPSCNADEIVDFRSVQKPSQGC